MDEVTGRIIGAAIEVHRALGPGLLESTYQQLLAHELLLREIPFCQQLVVPVIYKGAIVDCAYRLDFLIENVAVEIKSVASLERIHAAQMLTYMKLGGWPLGLLINFNVPVLARGIRRFIRSEERAEIQQKTP